MSEKIVGEERQVAVYGAGMVAVSIYYAVKVLYKNCKIVCFIVSERDGNPSWIDHVPVVTLNKFNQPNVKVLIATPENHHSAIMAELEKRGLDYVAIDSKKESALMEEYYKAINRFQTLRAYRPGNGLKRKKACIDVYMTRFHKDTPLRNPYNPPAWIHPIQAGAALTDERVADIQDDIEDNISKKNVNYSELSAMYWVGRNVAHKRDAGPKNLGDTYLGLFHYRRILDVTDEDLYRLETNEIDVILPYPTVHYPSIDEHHRRYVKDGDWNAMISALKELEPEYEKQFARIFAQPYFYNYNMFIAKEEIFKDYCDWLFPILERTEKLSSPKGWERADRYIGYLGENLTTLYFMYHQNDYKIAHTGRLMLI